MERKLLTFVLHQLVSLIFLGLAAPAMAQPKTPTVAINYQAAPPLDELRVFDIVVVEADHPLDPNAYRARTQGHSELFAYVSIGEALRSRAWFARMPEAMRPGTNAVWASAVIDQAHPEWPTFLLDEIVAPLWAKGYRGFFLDTMDSYQLISKTDDERKKQEEGLISAIKRIKAKYPEARLIANRGFEVLPALKNEIFMIAAESLFQGWNHGEKRYIEVNAQDREWLLGQFKTAKEQLGIPGLAIDYVAPRERSLQRETAKKILELGIQAYVTDPLLASIGTGRWQNQPRRLLVLHDTTLSIDLAQSDVARYLLFPIHHLGYRADILNVLSDEMPSHSLADRYAGVVSWFNTNETSARKQVQQLVKHIQEERLALVSFNELPFSSLAPGIDAFGLTELPQRQQAPLRANYAPSDRLVAHEARPLPRNNSFTPLALTQAAINQGAKSWLRVEDAKGKSADAIAITPWGGYAQSSFTVTEVPGRDKQQWVVNPFELLKQGLRLPPLPLPDVTTESGRRMLMIHIDGDGFASRAEIPGTPFAAQVMSDEFIQKYKVPHTVSIIQGEVAPNGLYKDLSKHLEPIARGIFALPHVELATHTFSHPFFWREAISGSDTRPNRLNIPGYTFDLDRELAGSARYVESLAPKGKKTQMLLWTGDCVPPPIALQRAGELGLLNMNGGDTLISKSNTSMTAVAPYGLRKGGFLQVYAPNQNENVYTNLWTGPFYGYERVIETFELTEKPERLKPINIYYHTYSASKTGSIAALRKVYDYTTTQVLTPVYGSEYARKVIDWEGFALARDVYAPTQHLRVAGDGNLRTLRLPVGAQTTIDWEASKDLAGFAHGPGYTYLHLTKPVSQFTLGAPVSAASPLVINANGKLADLKRALGQLSFTLQSHVAPQFVLAQPAGCRVKVNDQTTSGNSIVSSEVNSTIGLNAVAYAPALNTTISKQRQASDNSSVTILVSVDCR
jgi:polysaccharide biosynthesis protein PelA